MTFNVEFFLDRKKRTVNIKIVPGKTPIDRYDFVTYVESLMDVKNLEAFGPVADRGMFQINLQAKMQLSFLLPKVIFAWKVDIVK